ncbi:MAG: TetR/AcrR family transcriptional regulator [Firmicutes bacterium HGW-Firmicutes-14]|nr:MAG: TetR/AcrR family transcriptional regulator [Firmicutes bacterium HGW-Firmicutes-14]
MGIKERKQRERDEKRNLILNAAGAIVAEEGIDSLSVRKIADRIEYSPAIIYHYFENKEDIMQHLLVGKYREVVDQFRAVEINNQNPETILREFLKKYIKWAMKNREIYKNIMLNNSTGVLEYTSVLCRGAVEKRPAVGMLAQVVKELSKEPLPEKHLNGEPEAGDEHMEIKAQAVWASAFGLVIRMIVENIPEEQQERLIAGHIELITDGLRGGK